MKNSKIILSNKQITKELKNLIESFDKPTDEDLKKHAKYFSDLDIFLNKFLPRKYPFVKKITLEPELKELGYFDKYYFYCAINLYLDVFKLPEQEKLHFFIKEYNKIKPWEGIFSNLQYFYKDNKEIGENISSDIIETSYVYMNVLHDKFDLNSEDYGSSFYFYY